eukprot:355575-Karenia_brevis.AAC.1
MASLSLPVPKDKYCKGEFTSMLFIVFDGEVSRNKAIQGLREAKISRGNGNVWAKADQPLIQRTCESFLFGLRKQLIEWQFDKRALSVDVDTKMIKYDGNLICGPTISNGRFFANFSSTWRNWKEFYDSTEIQSLMAKAQQSLDRGAGATKGKGKQKSK